MCLFGTAAGAFRCEVLMLKWPGGGVLRPGSGAGRARTVAIIRCDRTICGDMVGYVDADADVREVNWPRDGLVERMRASGRVLEGNHEAGRAAMPLSVG
jgi:hypothetical protein